MSSPDDILAFWFDDLGPADPVPEQRTQFWFGGAAETDELIRERFSGDVERAVAGRNDDWTGTAPGTLALILLLDQFPRNIYRDTPRAFAADPKALATSLAGIEAGLDRELAVFERAFFYLPLEHAEDLALQKRSIALFRQLLDLASPAQREMCASFYDYAVRHHDIIARFGRFPHRNAILGRSSTAAEEAFLREPGSSF